MWRRLALIVLLVVLVPLPAGPVRADDPLDLVLGNPGETYPDIVPETTEMYGYKPLLGFDPQTGFTYGPPHLAFDTWSQNLGTMALELTADNPDFTTSTVSQCVSWRAPFVCRERRTVGGFVWHADHLHFHYQDFASYELRRLTGDGGVDYSAAGLVSVSDKVSFCLIDSTQVRDDALAVPTYVLCNPVRQGISPGYADIYSADLEGQQVSMEGLVDGRYALVITQDYNNTLYESDDTNNRLEVIFGVTNIDSFNPTIEIIERRRPVLGDDDDDENEEPCPGKGKGKGRPPGRGDQADGRGKGRRPC